MCLLKICLSLNTYNRKTKKKKGRQEKRNEERSTCVGEKREARPRTWGEKELNRG